MLHATLQSTADCIQSFIPRGVKSVRASCHRACSIGIGTGISTSTGTSTCGVRLPLRCCCRMRSRAAHGTDEDSPNTTNETRELGTFRIAAMC